MIRLHCTQKLLAKLPLDASGRLQSKRHQAEAANDASESPLSGWHANLITLQRRNCVLFVHDATRFPVLVTCLTQPDFAELDWHFQDGLMNTLLKAGANQHQLDAAAKALTPLVCDTNCDRSAQGTLNLMKRELDHLLVYDNLAITDLSAYRTGAWLADSSYNIKGLKDCVWPIRAMLGLLDSLNRE